MYSPKYHYSLDNLQQESEEKSYILGFILADGSVRSLSENKKRFEIGLAEIDIGQLEKVRSFLKSDHPIKTDNKGISKLSICGKELFHELGKYGIYPNKTLKEVAPIQYSLDRHYWRGIIDGDGYISIHKQRRYPQIGLCGTKEICQQFLDFVKANNIATSVTPKHRPPKINNHYSISFTSDIAHKIINLLYSNSTIHLDRKKLVADDINTWYSAGRKIWKSGYKHSYKWHKTKI